MKKLTKSQCRRCCKKNSASYPLRKFCENCVEIMKKETKKPRFSDYERVDTSNVITFGTSVYIRKDRQALIIVFPCGNELHFLPEEEIKK